MDLSVIVSGIMIGSTFGLIAGVSIEEKIRYIAISVFGGVLVAALGGLYAYGVSQLEVLLSLLFWSCLGFLTTFTVGHIYITSKGRGIVLVVAPTRRETHAKNIPRVKATFETRRRFPLGFKASVHFTIKNTTTTELDDLEAELIVTPRKLKAKAIHVTRDLPSIFRNESRSFDIDTKLGSGRNCSIDLLIKRLGIVLTEIHWDI